MAWFPTRGTKEDFFLFFLKAEAKARVFLFSKWGVWAVRSRLHGSRLLNNRDAINRRRRRRAKKSSGASGKRPRRSSGSKRQRRPAHPSRPPQFSPPAPPRISTRFSCVSSTSTSAGKTRSSFCRARCVLQDLLRAHHPRLLRRPRPLRRPCRQSHSSHSSHSSRVRSRRNRRRSVRSSRCLQARSTTKCSHSSSSNSRHLLCSRCPQTQAPTLSSSRHSAQCRAWAARIRLRHGRQFRSTAQLAWQEGTPEQTPVPASEACYCCCLISDNQILTHAPAKRVAPKTQEHFFWLCV